MNHCCNDSNSCHRHYKLCFFTHIVPLTQRDFQFHELPTSATAAEVSEEQMQVMSGCGRTVGISDEKKPLKLLLG